MLGVAEAFAAFALAAVTYSGVKSTPVNVSCFARNWGRLAMRLDAVPIPMSRTWAPLGSKAITDEYQSDVMCRMRVS